MTDVDDIARMAARRNWAPPPDPENAVNGKRYGGAPRANGGDPGHQANGKGGPGDDPLHSFVCPAAFEGLPVPRRQWLVSDYITIGSVTGLYGDGGVGKSLLVQQLMTSCATRTPWCGLDVMRCRALGLFCEDSIEELHERQNDINSSVGIRFSDLGDVQWLSGLGQDNTLAVFTSDGRMQKTDLFGRILRAAVAFDARLVVLDPVADLFGGNENDRHQVKQFINLLASIAIQIRGAVLLNAHPSREGLRTGNLDGASTAWNNSVRSRLSFARPEADENEGRGPDERVLSRRKANYAPIGSDVRLRWVRGAFVPVMPKGGAAGAVHRAACESVFLDLLKQCFDQGLFVSNSKNSTNYAPKVFGRRSDRNGYTRGDFEAAMGRLFEQRRLKAEEYNRFGNKRLAPVSQEAPE